MCKEGYQAESTQNKAENDSLVTYIATSEGLCVDPSKVAAIVEMPVPTNTAAVQRLLGMAQYLSKFLPHVSQLTKPLSTDSERHRVAMGNYTTVSI